MSKLLQSSAFRLAFGVVALFVVAAMLIGGYIMWRSNDLLTRQVLAMIEGEAASLRDVYSAGGIIALRQAIAERTARPGPTLYYLSTGARGRDVGNLSRLPPELATRPRGSTFVYDSVVGPQREQRLAVGIPFALGPDLKLLVGRDIEDQRHYARAVRVHVMAGLIALTFVGLLAGLWIARTILRRIDRITVASRAIMAGEWERRLPCNGSQDELDRLSANLNVMLDRIGELMAGMREVSDNIAHDLKTPLNRLRNRAEDALRGEQAEGHHRAALERVIDEADDLIRTFNALLAIARFESGAVGEQMQPVDLSTLVEDVAELFEPALDEAGLTLALEVERPSIAKVSRELVAQALVNLFENAIKYAPRDPGESPPQTAARPGDTVRAEAGPDIVLSLKRRGGSVLIALGDRGPGIPAADRERVLKRFVRLDASRSQAGSGLGLSLVAAIARLHAGSVTLSDHEPGLKVTLALPVAGPGGGAEAGLPTSGSASGRASSRDGRAPVEAARASLTSGGAATAWRAVPKGQAAVEGGDRPTRDATASRAPMERASLEAEPGQRHKRDVLTPAS